MVKEVRALGMETCMTLGMLNSSQAERLAKAGLDYYNHNLDTSPEFYGSIVTTGPIRTDSTPSTMCGMRDQSMLRRDLRFG